MPKMGEIEKQVENQTDDLEISHFSLENDSDGYFAKIIGIIEDIIVEEDFLNSLTLFMEKHWSEFNDGDENKLIYTDIFKEYLETIEKYIEKRLLQIIDGFVMCDFENELKKRHNELDGQIFEILETFSDFESFKNMILDYRNMKLGRSCDFSMDITVRKYKVKVDQ